MEKYFEKIVLGSHGPVDEDRGGHPLMTAGARLIAPVVVDTQTFEHKGREYRQGNVQLRLDIPATVSVDDEGNLIIHVESLNLRDSDTFKVSPEFNSDDDIASDNWQEVVQVLARVLSGQAQVKTGCRFDSSSFG